MSACMDGALDEIALEVVVLAHSHHAFPQCQFYYIVPAMQMQVSPYVGTLFPLPVYPLLIKVHEAVILPSSTDLTRAHTQVVERAGRLDSHLIRLASYIVLPSKWTGQAGGRTSLRVVLKGNLNAKSEAHPQAHMRGQHGRRRGWWFPEGG